MRDKKTPSSNEDLPIGENSHERNRDDWISSDWSIEDEAIFAALQSVSPPASMLERARERLREESSTLVEAQCSPSDPLDATPTVADARKASWRSVVTGRRALATAATIAVIAFGTFLLSSRPLSKNELAEYCNAQLELISAQPPMWDSVTAEDAARQLSALLQYSSSRLTLVGVKDYPDGGLSESCKVWKFRTNDGKSLYVFQLQEPRRLSNLSGQLELFSSGSSWSLAAVQAGNQLLVTAVSGDIDRYFRRTPFA